ncbi:hypothetical protein BDV40DRAFT_282822 [Aspergillus tamarii]|uniref:Major facilitator superfamily domain-containing protein n=1 Tax=Aspergillus tamarii TaxID=41984 RepID=A0A5N6UB68_ASPTM|nr:hypothetical protein BDV40DRAFT_282822 [Aspergillus tamarii]
MRFIVLCMVIMINVLFAHSASASKGYQYRVVIDQGHQQDKYLTLTSVGTLTGPLIAKTLAVNAGGDYLPAQIWAGTSLLVGTAALIAARVLASG